MPLSRTVFDSNVFDAGIFDATDITPLLFKVEVAPESKKVQQGESIVITITWVNRETTQGRAFLFDPGEIPQIQLYKPDATVLLAYANMYNVTTGRWSYGYNISGSADLGFYGAKFKAINGTKTVFTPIIKIFEVISG